MLRDLSGEAWHLLPSFDEVLLDLWGHNLAEHGGVPAGAGGSSAFFNVVTLSQRPRGKPAALARWKKKKNEGKCLSSFQLL